MTGYASGVTESLFGDGGGGGPLLHQSWSTGWNDQRDDVQRESFVAQVALMEEPPDDYKL